MQVLSPIERSRLSVVLGTGIITDAVVLAAVAVAVAVAVLVNLVATAATATAAIVVLTVFTVTLLVDSCHYWPGYRVATASEAERTWQQSVQNRIRRETARNQDFDRHRDRYRDRDRNRKNGGGEGKQHEEVQVVQVVQVAGLEKKEKTVDLWLRRRRRRRQLWHQTSGCVERAVTRFLLPLSLSVSVSSSSSSRELSFGELAVATVSATDALLRLEIGFRAAIASVFTDRRGDRGGNRLLQGDF